MTKTDGTKFPKMAFEVDEFPGCCGIAVINNFHEDEGRWEYTGGWGSNRGAKRILPAGHKTAEKQAEDCYELLLRRGKDFGVTTLQVSLVTRYAKPRKKDFEWDDGRLYKEAEERAGKGQFPGLEEILKREKWKTLKFVNPNHGNTVTLFTKHFPEWKKDILNNDY